MDKSNFPYSNYEPCMTHAYKQHVFHNSQTNDQKQRLKGASTYKRFLTDDISASLAFPIMPFYSHFFVMITDYGHMKTNIQEIGCCKRSCERKFVAIFTDSEYFISFYNCQKSDGSARTSKP